MNNYIRPKSYYGKLHRKGDSCRARYHFSTSGSKASCQSGSANPWTRKAVETLLYETLLYQATHGGEGYMSQVAGPRLYLLGLAPGAENTQPMQLRDRFTEPMIEFVM